MRLISTIQTDTHRTDHEYAIYQALQSTNEFGRQYAAQFPDTSKAKPAFARLPALIQEIGPVTTKPHTS